MNLIFLFCWWVLISRVLHQNRLSAAHNTRCGCSGAWPSSGVLIWLCVSSSCLNLFAYMLVGLFWAFLLWLFWSDCVHCMVCELWYTGTYLGEVEAGHGGESLACGRPLPISRGFRQNRQVQPIEGEQRWRWYRGMALIRFTGSFQSKTYKI